MRASVWSVFWVEACVVQNFRFERLVLLAAGACHLLDRLCYGHACEHLAWMVWM